MSSYSFDNNITPPTTAVPKGAPKPATASAPGKKSYNSGGFAQKKAPNTHLREEDSFANMKDGEDGPWFRGTVYGVENVLISLRGDKVRIKVGDEVVADGLETKKYKTKKDNDELGFGTPLIHPTNWLFFNVGKTTKGFYIRSRMGKERNPPDYESKAEGANTFGVTSSDADSDSTFGA